MVRHIAQRRRSQSVADVTDFTAPLAVNPDFSRLAENKYFDQAIGQGFVL